MNMNALQAKKVNYKKIIGLGVVSVFSYLASYYVRNLLSVATPSMLLTEEYTAEFIGALSSVYFLTYAFGQLINGFVGDAVNPRYMVLGGLTVAGAVTLVFPFLPFAWMQIACFLLMGFSLSMLRGPIMKMVSENLDKKYARTVCTCLTVATFAGPLVASLLAIAFKWKTMFVAAGALTICIAVISFVALMIFERKGIYSFKRANNDGFRGYLQLFKLDNFVFYMIIGGVTEVGQSAITFWIPTYLSDALGFDKVTSNLFFSVISVASAIAPFITLFIFNLIRERDIVMLRVGFLMAVLSFIGMIFIPNIWVKIVLLVFAKLSLSCCSAVLWSIYIPGMGETGKVSSINGVIDCTGYLVAAIANAVFASLVGMTWNSVIAVWCGIASMGLIASFIMKQKSRKKIKK